MQLQHKSKLKKHLTRALSLMLAFALALSTPLTTHADVGDAGDNTGGGEGGMSGSTSALAWSQYHQGYRMYIIDQNFVRISPTYDFVYSMPDSTVGYKMTNTRFDNASSPIEHHDYMIDDLQSWCDSSDEVPTPTKLVNGERIGNGYEFKQWFFNGQAGTSIPGQNNGGNNNGGNTGGTGSGNTSDDPNRGDNDTRADRAAANQLYNQAKSADLVYGNKISTNTNYTGSGGIANYLNGYNSEYECTYNDLKSFVNTNVSFIINNADYGSELDPKAVARKLISLYYSNNKQYYTECNVSSISCNNGEWHGFMDACADAYDNVSSSGTLASIKGLNESSEYLITQSIPLAGGEGSGPSPASNLVRKNNTIDVTPRYETAADALQDGCYLVVEPITWLYVRTNPTGNWQNPSTYESTRTYGTYWNLASKWVGTGGFYNTIMTKLFNNCLAISRTVTSPTGKTLQGIESTNQKSVADSLNYMNAGYGLSMHISKIHN